MEFTNENKEKIIVVEGSIVRQPVLNQSLAEKAADWWCEKLRAEGPRHDAGEDILSLQLNLMTGLQEPPTEEQIAHFRDALIPALQEELEKYPRCTLRVDYQPTETLKAAAKQAGIENSSYFPVKTNMEVTPERVTVSCGYRAAFVEI